MENNNNKRRSKRIMQIAFVISAAVSGLLFFQNCQNSRSQFGVFDAEKSAGSQLTDTTDNTANGDSSSSNSPVDYASPPTWGSTVVASKDLFAQSNYLKPVGTKANCTTENAELDLRQELMTLSGLYHDVNRTYYDDSQSDSYYEVAKDSLVAMRDRFRYLLKSAIENGVRGQSETYSDEILRWLDGQSERDLKNKIALRREQIRTGALTKEYIQNTNVKLIAELNRFEKRLDELVAIHEATIQSLAQKTDEYFRCYKLDDGSLLNIDIGSLRLSDGMSNLEKYAEFGRLLRPVWLQPVQSTSYENFNIMSLPNMNPNYDVSKLSSPFFYYYNFNNFSLNQTWQNLPSQLKTTAQASDLRMNYLNGVPVGAFHPSALDLGAHRQVVTVLGWLLSQQTLNPKMDEEIKRVGLSYFVKYQFNRLAASCGITCQDLNYNSIVGEVVRGISNYSPENYESFMARFKKSILINNILYRIERERDILMTQFILAQVYKENRWLNDEMIYKFSMYVQYGLSNGKRNFISFMDVKAGLASYAYMDLCVQKQLCSDQLKLNKSPNPQGVKFAQTIMDTFYFPSGEVTESEIQRKVRLLRAAPQAFNDYLEFKN